MLRQMSAAFCGVVIIFACSVPTKAAVKPAHLATRTQAHSDITKLPPFIGAASTYNPFRPGSGEGGILTAPAKTTARTAGLRPFKRSCARSLVASSRERPIARGSRSSKRQTSERSSKSMMLGRSSQDASSTLMSRRCSISTRRCSAASSKALRSLRFPARTGLQDRSDDCERRCPLWVKSGHSSRQLNYSMAGNFQALSNTAFSGQ